MEEPSGDSLEWRNHTSKPFKFEPTAPRTRVTSSTSDDHEALNVLNDQMIIHPENTGVTSEMQLAVDKWPNLISTGPTCSGVSPIETHDIPGNLSFEDE